MTLVVKLDATGSAHVYGNYGVYGDGNGVVMYLIGQNLAYIGVGKRVDNDQTYVVRVQEVTKLNPKRFLQFQLIPEVILE